MNETIDPIQRINDLRAKINAGEEISKEESAEAVRLIRGNRTTAVTPHKKSNVPLDLNDLFKK